MRINVLQHTPNEGPGMIQQWSNEHDHQMYVYHPYQYGFLPTAKETDMLVILGGPMSPNDDLDWIKQERSLIKELLDQDKPIFGACYGAQQIVKTMGYEVKKAPAKEVGWGPVYRRDTRILDIPEELTVLHWHEEMFEVPDEAQLLFSNDNLENQGFVMNHRVIGLQFHIEPAADNVREMVVNDFPYIKGSVLNQTANEILSEPVPNQNKITLFRLLDYITAYRNN
ncbi:type 1 glutamine amidotransferase [Lactobacillus halodurans]|uniref:Type 1 glutamine amidotransferase n=1 Tax=Companilactobacillus halodurans TaxID=2584183 RepID=A0A5P0ZMH3_9LACO|nr:type 1 glutamine amidotransferase [Companilactobacillus halodurans]MQS75417.1 type 1 glutamine amidotransferase [Companilactobacillus halodurans]